MRRRSGQSKEVALPIAAAAELVIRQVRLVPVGLDAGEPTAAAAPDTPVDLRLRGGRVVEVGRGLPRAPGEESLDAEGRWAIPGLWDAHVHSGQWAESSRRLDLSGTPHPGAVIDRVRVHLDSLPADRPDSLVVGVGYRSAAWPATPTVAALDAISGAHPVVLISGDSHNGWLNSSAMRLLSAPSVTGLLDEDDWFPVFARLAQVPVAAADRAAGYPAAIAAAAAKGVVGIVDLEFGQHHLAWTERFAAGLDALRVRVGVYTDGLDPVIAAGLRTGDPLPGGDGRLTMGPLKIITDGSLNTGTAYCHSPYPGASADHPRGKQTCTPAELRARMTRAQDAGLELAVHAIGDASVADALDAYAATGARGSIEHAQLMARSDIARMGRLGVRASVQPAHLLDDRDVTAVLWADRADRCFPLRSLVAAGVPLALGSDAPVSPLDPWLAMAAAVHRSADDREPWHAAESLTPAQALAASTDGQPTLAPGSRADLVLLDADPLAGGSTSGEQAEVLRTMRVAATVVAGRTTYLDC